MESKEPTQNEQYVAHPTSSSASLPSLHRPLTIGGEPNPTRPQTPEVDLRPEHERKELSPPGLLSFEALAILVPFSILGLLARLGISALVTHPNQGIFSLVWVQAAGCLVMGIAQSQKNYFMAFYPPLYLGITTGFCGSLTTFSGWQRDVFTAWAGIALPGMSRWHNCLEGFTRLLFTQAISVASFTMGLSIGRIRLQRLPPIPGKILRAFILLFSIIVYIAVFPCFFLLSPNYRSMATAALLFAYPGALTRHLLGSSLNTKIQSFPLGTFSSNTIGTIVTALAYIFLNLPKDPCNNTKMALLQGLIDGYAGCLSTVSTLIAEIHLMNRRHAWTYVITSWVIAQLFLILIIGSTDWTKGLDVSKTC
ncbi:hypothetical protein CPB86DRAFT_762360 [Serendipita vermifera]|nr:hypothetical protein CPB86DRAFT_762360 [Serendipita vermifera]